MKVGGSESRHCTIRLECENAEATAWRYAVELYYYGIGLNMYTRL
jgi:hypothetical protein